MRNLFIQNIYNKTNIPFNFRKGGDPSEKWYKNIYSFKIFITNIPFNFRQGSDPCKKWNEKIYLFKIYKTTKYNSVFLYSAYNCFRVLIN